MYLIKTYTFAISVLVCLCISCQGPMTNKANWSVDELHSIDAQKAFLLRLAESDQAVRQAEREALEFYGYGSPQHKEAVDNFMHTDQTNFAAIKAYLDRYGYPSLADHGQDTVYAPWIVLQHMSNLADRQEYSKYVIKAYKAGDLDGGKLTFFLNRSYAMMYYI